MKRNVIMSEAKDLFCANCFVEEVLRFAQDDGWSGIGRP
jgi:hypothetical protein